MPIVTACPSCRVRLTLGDDRAGCVLLCPKCDTRISVPGAPTVSPSHPPQAPRSASSAPPPIPTSAPSAFVMSDEEKVRAGVAVGIVAFALLAWLAAAASPERFASYNWDMFGGRVYASLAIGVAVEVAALVCAALFFGRDPRGTLAVGAAAGGALGAILSQYHPLMADPLARYLARPLSPALMLGFGGAIIGGALALVGQRATRTTADQLPPAPTPALHSANSDAASAYQRRALFVLLGVAGSALAVWLCVSFVGAIVGPRVVRTAAEWQTVRDGEEVEVRGVDGFDHSGSPFFPIDVPVVLQGERVVFCEFDSAVWETSDFRDWRNKIGPGSPLALRGTAHRNPAELRGCRPVRASK